METIFLFGGIALCLFGLGVLARHDWLRLTRPTRRVLGRVTGHRISRDSDGESFAAIYSFTAENGLQEVVDAVYHANRQPPVGTIRELAYPEGHPKLARPPRLWLWLTIYAGLTLGAGILAAKMLGFLH
jgi:hypothetical protein